MQLHSQFHCNGSDGYLSCLDDDLEIRKTASYSLEGIDYDIGIGDFKMSWNLQNSVFAIDDHPIDQIGCIHPCQGLEFDYAGVIIGDDMRYEK